MANTKAISRRRFLASTVSTAALASLPAHRVFAEIPKADAANGAQQPATSSPQESSDWKDSDWKNQGIENLSKSPHAKLRDIPVRAVTIQSGFWAPRREINVTKSIPTMHDLLEANGRMNNFRRLTGKSRGRAERTRLFRLRYLQVDRSSGVRAAVGRPSRTPQQRRTK